MMPSAGVDYTRWADPAEVGTFFADTGFTVIAHRTGMIGIPFTSPAAAVAAFRAHSGPWITLFRHLDADGRSTGARAILERHFADRSGPHPDGIALRATYSVIHLARAAGQR